MKSSINEKKLTYYQICKLAAQGRFDSIPPGYNIIWMPEQPNVCFNSIVEENRVIIVDEKIARPDSISVTGEVTVLMPPPFEPSLIEFGDVIIHTYFHLTNLKFYYNEDSSALLKPFIDKYYIFDANMPLKKSDYVFDAEVMFNGFKLKILNIIMESYNVNEKNVAEVNLVNDYVIREFQ